MKRLLCLLLCLSFALLTGCSAILPTTPEETAGQKTDEETNAGTEPESNATTEPESNATTEPGTTEGPTTPGVIWFDEGKRVAFFDFMTKEAEKNNKLDFNAFDEEYYNFLKEIGFLDSIDGTWPGIFIYINFDYTLATNEKWYQDYMKDPVDDTKLSLRRAMLKQYEACFAHSDRFDIWLDASCDLSVHYLSFENFYADYSDVTLFLNLEYVTSIEVCFSYAGVVVNE